MEMRVMHNDNNNLFSVNNYKLVLPNDNDNNNNDNRNNNNDITNNGNNDKHNNSAKVKNSTKHNKDTSNSNYSLENDGTAANRHPHNDPSSHRERAIDCPTSFVGVKKEPPKYPRPSSIVQTTPSFPSQPLLLQPSPATQQSTTQQPPKPQPAPQQQSGHINATTKVIVPSQNRKENFEDSEKEDSLEIQTEQQQRVHKYQEDLQARMEREERSRKEGEMLRGSLRDSKKLQALQGAWKNRSTPGCLNASYVDEEGDTEALVAGTRAGSRRRKKKKIKVQHLEIEEIVTSVKHVQKYLQDQEEKKKLEKVSELVKDEKFQKLLKVHNKVVDVRLSDIKVPGPDDGVMGQREVVVDELRRSEDLQAVQLMDLLRSPFLKNLFSTHDKIIQAEYNMHHNRVLSSELEDLEYCEGKKEVYGGAVEVKVVRMLKGTEPLGATVLNDGTALRIGRLVVGGVAWESGLLKEGDELLDINGHDVRGMHVNSVAELMSHLSGKITFLVHPNPAKKGARTPQHESYYRALFNYDPLDDHYLPCKDLSFSFVRGDILKVSDTSDNNWWQAYREGEKDQLAGLVPSPTFQQAKEELNELMMRRKERDETGCRCSHKRRKYEEPPDEYLIYEEVALHSPTQQRRPVVVVGSKGLGAEGVVERMVKEQPTLFETPVKHTTKPRKEEEVDGRDYVFVSKSEFKSKMEAGLFIEHVSKDKHMYAVSYESVWNVVAKNKSCILMLQPQSLKAFKNSPKNFPLHFQNPSFSDPSFPTSTLSTRSSNTPSFPSTTPDHHLMPFFLFLSPPNIEGLRQLYAAQKMKISEEALKRTIEEGRAVDQKHGHLFDSVVVVRSLEGLYREMLQVVKEVVEKDKWVPKKWVE